MLDVLIHKCRRCGRVLVMDRNDYYLVCTGCGLTKETALSLVSTYKINVSRNFTKVPICQRTYKRINYFNERLARLCNIEPHIQPIPWFIIKMESLNTAKYGDLSVKCTREDVGKVLKSVNVPPHYQFILRSRKYRKNLMTNRRFFNKFMEKWKTIMVRLTGRKTPIPSTDLLNFLRFAFMKLQSRFEDVRHKKKCDKKTKNCDKIHGCLYNFVNYDFLIVKLLQIAELNFGFKNVYNTFKDFLPMLSLTARKVKLRPVFKEMIRPFRWKCPDNE